MITSTSFTSSHAFRPGIARRAAVGSLAGLAVFAGAATAPASAMPEAPLPAFTDGEPGLASLLLDGSEATDVIGSTVEVNRTVFRLGNNETVRPSQCVGAYLAAQADAYADATPVDIAVRQLSGKSALLSEAVVELSSKREALAQVEAMADSWKTCGGLTMTERSSDGSPQEWELGTPVLNADKTIMTLSQTLVGGRATCERAIAAYREVVIDVLSCSGRGSAAGTAYAVVEAVAEKASAPAV